MDAVNAGTNRAARLGGLNTPQAPTPTPCADRHVRLRPKRKTFARSERYRV
jgi:hypothetical protein